MAQRSGAERIREYKQLLDEGMITKEEFEAKKAQILSEAESEGSEETENAGGADGNVFSGHYFQDKANNGQGDQTQQNTGGNAGGGISTKATGVLAYLTWIGFLIAYFAGDRQGARFHLNQGLVVNLFGLLTGFPIIGKIWGLFILVCMILGVVNASNGENKEVPLIGGIHLL